MSAKKSTPEPRRAGPLAILQALVATRPGRLGLLALAIAGSLAGAGAFAWRHVDDYVLTGPQYRLSPEQVFITPTPDWIRTDIKAEVLRDASLDNGPSILEAELVERVASAFAMHPWVAQVERVTKHHPARVDVRLVYRRPVAMVEVPGGLYPVDVEGVLLPSADFSPADARNYPRVSNVQTIPIGPVGTYWGDARVRGAARIGVAVAEAWSELGLARIVPLASPSASATDGGVFEIYTKGQTRIIWGHEPGAESAGEPRAEAKLAVLRSLMQQHGTLDHEALPQIDLRQADERSPRTAVLP